MPGLPRRDGDLVPRARSPVARLSRHARCPRMIRMRRTTWLVLVASWCYVLPAEGQSGWIEGIVVDSATHAPLSGVHVTAQGESTAATWTDARGRFRLSVWAPGSYAIALKRMGYEEQRHEGVVSAAAPLQLRIALLPLEIRLDPVQVTGSRTSETALDAPVSVSVVDRRDINAATTFTPLDHVRGVTGVDFVTKGLLQHIFSVRGAMTLRALPVLVDYRNAAVPSTGFNFPYLVPLSNADLERVEVERGPGSALYGSDADRGVVHLVTRSPFDSRGATVSLAGGERSILQATARYAAAFNSRLAFMISGAWFQGDDWQYIDPNEVQARQKAIQDGADPDTLLIAQRDFRVKHAAGEARLDWRPDGATTVVASAGAAQAINLIDASGAGAVQLRDYRSSFAQVRLQRGQLFANFTYNLVDAGGSYRLRTGLYLIDHSRQGAAQLQHGATLGPVALLYGVDSRWTDPRTGGSISGLNEDNDQVTEWGGYLHARAALSRRVDLVSAVRVDRNDRLNDFAFSPRVGVVYRPAAAHAVRLTYNRAFSSPDPAQLFLDFPSGRVVGYPYVTRTASVPKGGYSFRRDCAGGVGGLCMRSPYNPAGEDQYLPADASLLWDAAKAIMAQRGFDLSAIPAPNGSQVASSLRRYVGRGQYTSVGAGQVTDLEAQRRTFTRSLEAGYKGMFADRVLVGLDAYVSRVRDPLGGRAAATPNVFYDSATLAGYLSGYLPADSAATVAREMASVPVGIVSPRGTQYPVDVLLLTRQGGAYTIWGMDVSITAALTSRLTVSGTYSWLSRNEIPDVVQAVDDVVLSVPRQKCAVSVGYRDEHVGLSAMLQGRVVGEFHAILGSAFDGQIPSYGVVDARLGYELPWPSKFSVSLDVQNVLDHRHVEFAGAPQLGRLLVSRVQVRL